MFLDESGEASIKNADPDFNIFSLCGVVIAEPEYLHLDQQIKDLKIKYWDDENIIFHSYPMRRKLLEFKIFNDKDIYLSFMRDIEKILTDTNYLLISCVVLKDLYKEFYPSKNFAYEKAMEFICERAAFLMNTLKGKLHICIEKRERSKNRLVYKHYLNFIKNGTKYNGPHEFRNLSPRLHFRSKFENKTGLQFADICSYPIAFKGLYPERPQKTYEVIKCKIHSWNGIVDGIGLKIFPKKNA